MERVQGRERKAKAVRKREKGTCGRNLGKRTGLGLVPNGVLYFVDFCIVIRFALIFQLILCNAKDDDFRSEFVGREHMHWLTAASCPYDHTRPPRAALSRVNVSDEVGDISYAGLVTLQPVRLLGKARRAVVSSSAGSREQLGV